MPSSLSLASFPLIALLLHKERHDQWQKAHFASGVIGGFASSREGSPFVGPDLSLLFVVPLFVNKWAVYMPGSACGAREQGGQVLSFTELNSSSRESQYMGHIL